LGIWSHYVYVKFNYDRLRIDKSLGNFKNLITPTPTTPTTTTFAALGDPSSSKKRFPQQHRFVSMLCLSISSKAHTLLNTKHSVRYKSRTRTMTDSGKTLTVSVSEINYLFIIQYALSEAADLLSQAVLVLGKAVNCFAVLQSGHVRNGLWRRLTTNIQLASIRDAIFMRQLKTFLFSD